jgi:hypothetical protein
MWPCHSAYVELFGRPATTAIQTIPPLRRSPSDKERATRRSQIDTCHALAANGEVVAKCNLDFIG